MHKNNRKLKILYNDKGKKANTFNSNTNTVIVYQCHMAAYTAHTTN